MGSAAAEGALLALGYAANAERCEGKYTRNNTWHPARRGFAYIRGFGIALESGNVSAVDTGGCLYYGVLLAVCHALENTTVALSAGPPRAAAVRSHFDDCPDAHSHYCFHGTCRFLVQQAEPSCVCHSGFVGMRCEHADLLAVVAASQKKQTITALVVVSVIASVVLIVVCVLIHCCRIRKHCEGCRTFICRHEKPNGLLKGGTSCCHSETVV